MFEHVGVHLCVSVGRERVSVMLCHEKQIGHLADSKETALMCEEGEMV